MNHSEEAKSLGPRQLQRLPTPLWRRVYVKHRRTMVAAAVRRSISTTRATAPRQPGPCLLPYALKRSRPTDRGHAHLGHQANCVSDQGRFVLSHLAPCGFIARTVRLIGHQRNPGRPRTTRRATIKQTTPRSLARWLKLQAVDSTDAS